MRSKILKELKESFTPYIPFWEEWKQYRFNGLTGMDIYILEVQIANDFVIDISDFIMFYNQLAELQNLEKKLRQSYVEFQKWLVLKFQVTVVCLANEVPIELFFRIPFDVFKKLQGHYQTISPELVKVLQKFNCSTVGEIFFLHSCEDFRDTEKFSIVVEFQITHKIKQIVNQTLRKEVIPSKMNCTLN